MAAVLRRTRMTSLDFLLTRAQSTNLTRLAMCTLAGNQ
jgi:hypothetical protein